MLVGAVLVSLLAITVVGRTRSPATPTVKALAGVAGNAPAAKLDTRVERQPTFVAPAVAGAYSWDYRWEAGHPAVGAPRIHAREAVVVDVESQRVLYSYKPHGAIPMASTTKLMTGMITLDAAAPETLITIPAEAAGMPPTVMGLTAGERIPVRDVLYGLMLDSGNDAAEALAAETLGRNLFIKAMNQKAAAMGLGDTHFVNPSGIDEARQYSSPHDLAIMAAYVYQHYPLLADVVHTKEEAIYGNSQHKAFFPQNFNRLLWSYPGAIGFKTGDTDAAGFCVVSGARRGSHTLIAVVLGDPMAFSDSTALLDYGFRRAS